MNFSLGFIVMITMFVGGVTLMAFAMSKGGEHETETGKPSAGWLIVAIIGILMLPAAFLLGNYINLVWKPF